MRKLFLKSLLLVLVLTACQKGTAETVPATLNELAAGTEPPVLTEQAGSYPTSEIEPTPLIDLGAGTEHPVVTEQAGSYPTPEPFPFPSSESGLITIHGILVARNPFAMAPDPEDPVFLVPLSGDSESISTIPPFTIGEVPRATVDIRNGEFVFANIQPGQYAIVVLLTTGSQVPAKYIEGGNLAIIKLSESDIDQVVEVGYVGVP